ncbi:MAG: hypothetical protein HY906_27975, partial [Deltaproteobacteria bacterium]|nr:hypothetical protein [Deltaproteobacteria bacterium]
LFVTSTDNNELRVMDLAPASGATRAFVTAPNPLEPLSIPVLDRPGDLAQTSSWQLDRSNELWGDRIFGTYVFATRPGGAEISVVGADEPKEFREVRRVVTAAPVTATAGWNDGALGVGRLYFATWDGLRGAVYAVDLPPQASVLRGLAQADLDQRTRLVVSFTGESVAALLPVPPLATRTLDGVPFCAGTSECLAVATRRAAGAEGRALLLDPSSLAVAGLAFPGPVRRLETAGCRKGALEAGCGLLPGLRIFGVLDEERCGGPQCGGVVAVDTLSGTTAQGFAPALDSTGYPMVPVVVGSGLVMGLALAPGGALTLPPEVGTDGKPRGVEYGVLGAVTSSSGNLLFFDAEKLHQIDTDPAVAVATTGLYRLPNGESQPDWVNGPYLVEDVGGALVGAVRLADGAWRSQTLVTIWEGVIPGFNPLPSSDADGTRLRAPGAPLGRVLVGDAVVFLTATGRCVDGQGTDRDARVTAVGADFLDVDAVPAGCTLRTGFEVRAGAAAPYVVQGTLAGYLGRAAPGGTLAYTGPYLVRPSGFDPSVATLHMRFGAPSPAPGRKASWEITIDGNFAPFASDFDSSSVGCLASLPGSAVYDTARQRLFIASPSADGVLEVNPFLAFRGALGTNAQTYCYR